MRTVQAIVTGAVQGVGYRVWTEGQAQSLGLDGWVRNRRDGC
jgi:acylphosphatase